MKFWELYKEGHIVQGALTLMFGGTVIVLLILDREVPMYLVGFVATILGFYFGSKTQAIANGK